jgi:glutamate synthase (NADPH/NADH) small chain
MTKPHGWLDDEELKRRIKGLYDYEQVEVPRLPPEQRLRSSEEVMRGYTFDEAKVEALRCMQCQDPPCVKACPAHLDVPGYCQAIVDGDLKKGLKIIMEAFPIPGSCARICYHPCTDVCLKGVEGTPIEIPRLRRFITDSVSQYDLDYELPEPTGFRVAVIGSGPAGLACAYHLRRKGHRVVVFERDGKPGGTLCTIPDYRLPDKVLQEEIKVLEWLGVEIKTNSPIEGDGCIDKLLEEFDAVFIGVGAVKARALEIEGKGLEGVYHGYELLKRLDAGGRLLGERAAIVGGGDVAMDALRTALRECEAVYLIYRRSPLEMPASHEEVYELAEEALKQEWHHLAVELATERRKERIRELFSRLELLTMEQMERIEKDLVKELKVEIFERLAAKRLENLVVHFLANPTRVLGEDGRVKALELVRMEPGPPDEQGRRRPIPVKGSEFLIEVDTVVFAIGQEIDISWLGRDHGLELAPGNRLITHQFETSRPGVFAGGDGVRGPASMIEALGDGRYAAEAIDRWLKGGKS